MFSFGVLVYLLTESGYPPGLQDLAMHVQQPNLLFALCEYLFLFDNPDCIRTPNSLSELPQFHGHVRVHHSALARFFAPSDLCGTGGMRQE
jgi:hypothetical protein